MRAALAPIPMRLHEVVYTDNFIFKFYVLTVNNIIIVTSEVWL
jgi:hypothetical protein